MSHPFCGRFGAWTLIELMVVVSFLTSCYSFPSRDPNDKPSHLPTKMGSDSPPWFFTMDFPMVNKNHQRFRWLWWNWPGAGRRTWYLDAGSKEKWRRPSVFLDAMTQVWRNEKDTYMSSGCDLPRLVVSWAIFFTSQDIGDQNHPRNP